MSTLFAQTIIIGLISGCVYSLLAMGMVLVYRTTGVLNIAHGGVGILAGFVAWDLITYRRFPYLAGVLAGVAFAVLLALAFERYVARKLPSAGAVTVATLGLLLITQGIVFVVPWWSNNSAQVFASPLVGKSVDIPGADFALSYDRVVLVITVTLFFVGCRFLLRRTRLGLAMRAVADDPAASRLMGVHEQLVSPVVWALAFGIAAVSTVLLSHTSEVLGNTGIVALTLKALVVTFVGGLVSLPLTVVGALALGVMEEYSKIYLFRIDGLSDAVPFILMVAVLVIRLARPTKALGEEALATA